MCDERKEAYISIPLNFPFSFKFLVLVLFLNSQLWTSIFTVSSDFQSLYVTNRKHKYAFFEIAVIRPGQHERTIKKKQERFKTNLYVHNT